DNQVLRAQRRRQQRLLQQPQAQVGCLLHCRRQAEPQTQGQQRRVLRRVHDQEGRRMLRYR
ncbi:hypothetical protein BN1723_019258, partial [Verticillium longisporum]